MGSGASSDAVTGLSDSGAREFSDLAKLNQGPSTPRRARPHHGLEGADESNGTELGSSRASAFRSFGRQGSGVLWTDDSDTRQGVCVWGGKRRRCSDVQATPIWS